MARFAHRVDDELDVEAMNRACRTLVGIHDFASFASNVNDEPEKSTIRQVYQARVTRNADMVVFNIVANAFVRHQIRSTAGALVQVGLNKLSEAEFISLLEAKKVGLAGPTLPACGLCLMRVNYYCAFEEMK
jgi:tRNA pseudouridine38-40 synthase